jgi:hypothetical protein
MKSLTLKVCIVVALVASAALYSVGVFMMLAAVKA